MGALGITLAFIGERFEQLSELTTILIDWINDHF
jgi:hypothetical protein